MPSDSGSANKRRNTAAKATSEPSLDDHRKRRRNRTTQSCHNCHATKRMCDRKRPCSRCTQLGLTGLCVYEVDDPTRKSDSQNDSSRLVSRIAELEGVIRELKNKPHPRWTDNQDRLDRSPGFPSSVDALGGLPWQDLSTWDSPHSSNSSFSTPSPLLVPPPIIHFDSESRALLEPYHGPSRIGSGCGCVGEPACYNAVQQLAADLRRAREVLSRSLDHDFGPPCVLSAKISELESLTMNALGSIHDMAKVSVTPERIPFHEVLVDEWQVRGTRDFLWDESGLPAHDDSFMSWISSAIGDPE